jgi:tetratricopeptide (TPR) repeat protein
MGFKPIVLIIIFLLANSADGLKIASSGHVIGGGMMYGYTQCNGVKDYINGAGDQTYVRSLNSNENEDILSSSYEYKQDPSLAIGANNTHYAGIYDSSTGIEHYVSVFSLGSVKSNAVLKSTETGVETSFISNSENGSIAESVIDSGKRGPAFNCEIDSASRAPMKIAETYLQGKFTFESKLSEEKVPENDAIGMRYKVDSINMMDVYQVVDGKQTPSILQSNVVSPEGQAIIYYNEARSLFSNASKIQAEGDANGNQTAKDEANTTFEKALDIISLALDLNPRYYNALIQKGNILMRLKEYSDALTEFDRAVDVTKDSTSLRRKGAALLELGRYEEAFTAFNDALKLSQADESARTGLRNTFAKIEGSISKNSGTYYYFKGVKEFYEGDAGALASLEQSINLGLKTYSLEFATDAEEKLTVLRILNRNLKMQDGSGEKSSDIQNSTPSITG